MIVLKTCNAITHMFEITIVPLQSVQCCWFTIRLYGFVPNVPVLYKQVAVIFGSNTEEQLEGISQTSEPPSDIIDNIPSSLS